MRLKLYKDWVLTSSEGDLCYTLKQVKKVQDENSKNFGNEYDIIDCYPTTIESALNIIYEREKYNSKAGEKKHYKSDAEPWWEYIKELQEHKRLIHVLAEEIGIDKLGLLVHRQSKEFLSQGDEPECGKAKRKTVEKTNIEDDANTEIKKRGRKKKE
jgi:hypothetical protein